jgi:hypothetical protein
MDFFAGYFCRMDTFCFRAVESRRLSRLFWRCERDIAFWQKAIWARNWKHFSQSKKA